MAPKSSSCSVNFRNYSEDIGWMEEEGQAELVNFIKHCFFHLMPPCFPKRQFKLCRFEGKWTSNIPLRDNTSTSWNWYKLFVFWKTFDELKRGDTPMISEYCHTIPGGGLTCSSVESVTLTMTGVFQSFFLHYWTFDLSTSKS